MTRTLAVVADTPLESLVDRIYRNRFPREVLARRAATWKILCDSWFSRYVPADGRVLEVAAGYCEFINNITAAERVAVDLNPETRHHAGPGVVVHEIAAERLADVVPAGHFDAAFMSNFLEHCRTARAGARGVPRRPALAETWGPDPDPRPELPQMSPGVLRLLRPPPGADREVRRRGAPARRVRCRAGIAEHAAVHIPEPPPELALAGPALSEAAGHLAHLRRTVLCRGPPARVTVVRGSGRDRGSSESPEANHERAGPRTNDRRRSRGAAPGPRGLRGADVSRLDHGAGGRNRWVLGDRSEYRLRTPHDPRAGHRLHLRAARLRHDAPGLRVELRPRGSVPPGAASALVDLDRRLPVPDSKPRLAAALRRRGAWQRNRSSRRRAIPTSGSRA